MKKLSTFLTLILLVVFVPNTGFARAARRIKVAAGLVPVRTWSAPPQAAQAKTPGWKRRDEDDAFQAMATEKDPNKRISLAEDFLQKFANSDFKPNANVAMLQTYGKLSTVETAPDADTKAAAADTDNDVQHV